MQNSTDTIRLLILDTSRNEAEELVNLLRNAGRATQAKFIESEEHLLELLNSKSWDLFYASERSESLTAEQALTHIKKLELDIPLILLSDSYDSEKSLAALQGGINDVVPMSESERLLLVSLRELDSLYQRRARRRAEISLRDAEKRCQLLLNSSRDAIAYVHDGMHIYANQAYVELFGYQDFEELEGMPLMDMVAAKDQADLKTFLRDYDDNSSESDEFSCTGYRDDESEFETTLLFSSARYDGEHCTQILIRAAGADAQAANIAAQQDTLTGLQTQPAFEDSISKAIHTASETGQKFAAFYIQLDDFIPLKNRLGAAPTNLVLGDVAKALKQVAVNPERLARVDEFNFALLVSDMEAEAAVAHGEKICQAIAANHCNVSSEDIEITASVGIAVVNENSETAGAVLHKAKEAAAFVKQHQQGDGAHLHSVNEQDAARNEQMAQLLRRALDKNLFKLVFQPIVSLRGDSGEHYEALLRMPDEDGSDICPSEFMQAAHDHDLTRDIDFWVIEESIRRLKNHLEKGRKSHLLLNITKESLFDAALLPKISELLNEARMPGDSIIFQFSETDATANMAEAKTFIRGINELHCKVAITHFGRALNPFNTLKQLPASYVKIDGSFIAELTKDEDSKDDLKSLVSSLHTQGKLTIAPMVDTASLLPILWQAGINYIQGYYIQQPSDEMDYDFTTDDDDEEEEISY
ncbi:MAG: EAL domain-containing protein [Pseudomonadales bacterium]|jgi:diguanylate cyclase (GGDEF)-like protein/PAS domain S-box-containing protein